VLEKETDKVMIEGLDASRVACSEIPKPVSLTEMVFADGSPSGRADENAHSSSSAGGAGTGVLGFGVKLAKSNMDIDTDCWGVDWRIGDVRAANGSTGGACTWTGFEMAAACCCWNSEGWGVDVLETGLLDPKAENEV